MKPFSESIPRRRFIRSGALLSASLGMLHDSFATTIANKRDELYMIGPIEGYSPHIGTIVSMLNYNRHTIIKETENLSMAELDYLFDENANTIGALLMHLAAVDKWYYNNCFENRSEFTEDEKKIWNPGLELGDAGRKEIKGKEISYYHDMLKTTREATLKAFRQKDDKWLFAVDPEFSKDRKFNNYWKWFHVCEHESNHRGQISWLRNRLPGAKPGND